MTIRISHLYSWLTGIAVAVGATGAYAASMADSSVSTLQEAMIAAENYSAQISASRHQEAALQNRAVSARQLPDPTLSIAADNIPVQGNSQERFTRSDMTMYKIGIQQMFVSSRKRDRKAQSFLEQAQQTAAGRELIRSQLQQQVATSWFDLAFARQSQSIIENLKKETQRQLGAQKAAVAANAAPASAIALRILLNSIQTLHDNAVRDERIARANLKELTGEQITNQKGKLPDIESLPLERNALFAQIPEHPEVLQAARGIDVAQAQSAQSAIAAMPDIGVQVTYGYRPRNREDLAGVMVSIPLSIFQGDRQDRNYAADKSMAHGAQDRYDQVVRLHQAQLETLLAKWDASKSVYERQVKENIALQKERLQLVLTQYRNAASSISEVLEARRALLQAQIDAINAQRDLARNWAALAYLVPQNFSKESSHE